MNFSLILFVLTLFTGFFYLLDAVLLKPRRRADAHAALQALSQSGQVSYETQNQVYSDYMRQPTWLEYTASFFPVVLFVFVLRSFVVEPFKIPSGSMIPTLVIGDLILVNKFSYGIRLPVVDKKIIPIASPKPGDVVVFRYPVDPSLDYIKRVVAVGGDVVEYRNKRLLINGKAQETKQLDNYYDNNTLEYSLQFQEQLSAKTHRILNDEDAPPFVVGTMPHAYADQCQYDVTGFRCAVPEGHYFMMGDNRDNSSDSRIWGFVSDDQIVGKAFLVWMNFSDFSRIGFFN